VVDDENSAERAGFARAERGEALVAKAEAEERLVTFERIGRHPPEDRGVPLVLGALCCSELRSRRRILDVRPLDSTSRS
jgi:hypothetical protein